MLPEYNNAAIHGADGSIGGAVARPPPERGAVAFLAGRAREPLGWSLPASR